MELVELKSHVGILSGFAFNSKLFNSKGDGVPLIRIRDVGKNISKTFYPGDYDDKFVVKDGDFLIGMDGDFRLSEWLGGKALLNQRVCKIWSKNQNILYDKYLLYLLPRELKFIEDTTSFATVKHLSVKKIQGVKIPLPPLKTQKRIAAILDEADALRQLNKQLIQKYDALIQSLFLEMFGDPVTNPKGWEIKKISEFAIVSSGSTPSRKNKDNYNGDIPWVKTGEVNGKVIYFTEEKITKFALENSSCKLYPKNSIIIAMYGQGKTRGQVGILGVEATTNQACAVIQIQSDLNYIYLFRLLQLSYENLRNLGRGGNQPNLNSGLIKKYNVSIPPIHLQTQFAERVQLIEAQKQQAQDASQKSDALFNSLLQKAFKGEL